MSADVDVDVPHVSEIRRFSVYAVPDDDDTEDTGRALVVGAEFPSGECLVSTPLTAGPVSFSSMDRLRESADALADTGEHVCVEYEDPEL